MRPQSLALASFLYFARSAVGILEAPTADGGEGPGLSQYVNAFIGSEGPDGSGFGGGDIFVGAARPFGVVKVGIDSTAANWSTAVLNGGWTPDGNVTGFSMMHESGTGGAPKYGLVSQMPLVDVEGGVNVLDNITYCQARVSQLLTCMTGLDGGNGYG